MTARLNPFTTEDLEEMERCKNRICLTLLMATAVVNNLPTYLDARLKEVTASDAQEEA